MTAFEPLFQIAQLYIDNFLQALSAEHVEHNRLVDPVEELRSKRQLQSLFDMSLDLPVGASIFGHLLYLLAGKIARHNNHSVLKVNRPPFAVGESSIVKNLKQHIEHIDMGLFDFIEQNHRIWLASYRLGQPAALVPADIPRRRTDQTRHRMRLHKLTHIDSGHAVGIVKQKLRQRLGQLGLTDTGRSQKQKHADRPIRIAQTRTIATNRIADRTNRLVLADNARANLLFHLHQPLTLTSQQPNHRNPRPLADNLSDMLSRHPVMNQLGAVGLDQQFFCRSKLLLQLLEGPVLDTSSCLEIALPLRFIELG